MPDEDDALVLFEVDVRVAVPGSAAGEPVAVVPVGKTFRAFAPGQGPDFRSIARFRKRHLSELVHAHIKPHHAGHQREDNKARCGP